MLENLDEVREIEAVSDGEEAIKRVMTDPPDVITLDLNMPRMDGFTFLRWLMRNHPLPVVVVSSEGGEQNVFKALDLGALDFIVKPLRYASERIMEIEEDVQSKVRAVAAKDMGPYLKRLKVKTRTKKEGEAAKPAKRAKKPRKKAAKAASGILLLGASTGGPSALQRVLAELPEDYPLPIVVVQHMPPVFTNQFAIRLDRNTLLRSREADDGDQLEPGLVLVVPGGTHLKFDKSDPMTVRIVERKENDRFVPSVNVTFKSAAASFGNGCVAVILTGMGSDGAEGMAQIKEAGGLTLAESDETAVVYGMPRAAIENGSVRAGTPLERIPRKVMELTQKISGLKNGSSDAN
jgi:two-component system chemotaxis response regulator CheB